MTDKARRKGETEEVREEEAPRRRDPLALGVSVATFLVLIVSLWLVIGQNDDLQKSTDANRATICAAARIISLAPVRQYPGETAEHYHKRLRAAGIFLRLASGIDCKSVLLTYGIRIPEPVPPVSPGGGDSKRPQTGSQLPRPGGLRRDHPGRPTHRPLTLRGLAHLAHLARRELPAPRVAPALRRLFVSGYAVFSPRA